MYTHTYPKQKLLNLSTVIHMHVFRAKYLVLDNQLMYSY